MKKQKGSFKSFLFLEVAKMNVSKRLIGSRDHLSRGYSWKGLISAFRQSHVALGKISPKNQKHNSVALAVLLFFCFLYCLLLSVMSLLFFTFFMFLLLVFS